MALAREQLAMARELMEECRSVQSRSRGGRGGRGVKGGGGSGIGGGSGRGRRGGAGGIEETATKAVSEKSFQEGACPEDLASRYSIHLCMTLCVPVVCIADMCLPGYIITFEELACSH